jgi:5-methylcytosine-specific restriction protein A
MDPFFVAASAQHQKREKSKARELRGSLWWRQVVGKGICYHCEKKFLASELTMDHLIPIARGGMSNKKNCVPSCKDCNTHKGYKLTVELAFEKLKAEQQASEEDLKEDSFEDESDSE